MAAPLTQLTAGVHYLTPTVAVHVFDSGVPGPTAIVQAGIHGDEIAGVHAVCELLEDGLRPERGRLLLIPVMNAPAYRNRTRAAPDGLDLNRCFPGDAKSDARERRLAAQFMQLMHDERPALVATLHESWKRFHPEVPQSFGQTLVYGVKPMPAIVAPTVARMNEQLDHPYEVWAPHYYPVATSSSEVIEAAVGCIALCVETWMGFEERRRIDLQKRIVRVLLDQIGVLAYSE